MARERRTRIPGIPKDAERNLETIIREFEDRIRLLERKTGRAGFVSANTAALAGEFLNIEAPAAGLTIILPESTPALRNARVTLNTRNANPVKVVAIGGTVNGAEFVTNDSAGTFEAVCNGFDGWSLPGYVTPGGSTPTWAQVLIAGNTSGASNPTLDAGQGLVVAGGQSAGAGDIRSASDISLDAATDIHLHADGAIHIGHAGATQEIHGEASTIELLTDVNGVNISAATTANITAGSSSTIQTGTFFAVTATGLVNIVAGTTASLTATTTASVTGGGNGLAATSAAAVLGAGTTGVTALASSSLTLQAGGANPVTIRTNGTARFAAGGAGGWAIGGNEGADGQYKRSGGAGAPPTWATISIGELGAIAANTFVGNITGSAAAPTANSLATLAGAGLTYAAGVMAVGAGTGITANANDVQLSTVIAESFFGNFTAGVAAPTARAGSSVAGAGLTYTAGGTLAVGAGKGIVVNANDVAVKDPVVQQFTTSGTNNDVSLNADTNILRVDTGNNAWRITGFSRSGGNFDGDRITVENASNTASVGGLLSQTGSAAGNQIVTPQNVERAGMRYSAELVYDGTDGFWRVVSETGWEATSMNLTGSFFTVDSTGAVTLAADAASSFTTSVGDLTLQTTAAGSRVIVSGADDVLIEAVADDVFINSGGLTQFTSGTAVTMTCSTLFRVIAATTLTLRHDDGANPTTEILLDSSGFAFTGNGGTDNFTATAGNAGTASITAGTVNITSTNTNVSLINGAGSMVVRPTDVRFTDASGTTPVSGQPFTSGSAQMGAPFILWKHHNSGTGAAGDEVFYNANAPFAFRIINAGVIVETGVAASTVTFRTATGGGGSTLSNAMSTGTAGAHTSAGVGGSTSTTQTIAAGGTLVARLSDVDARCFIWCMCVRV